MAGPGLEIFRFGLYMLFPIGFMLYFGDPKWYEKYVLPIRGRFVPPETDFVHPRTAEELHEALEHSHEHGQAKERASRIGADASVVRQFDAWHARDQERLV